MDGLRPFVNWPLPLLGSFPLHSFPRPAPQPSWTTGIHQICHAHSSMSRLLRPWPLHTRHPLPPPVLGSWAALIPRSNSETLLSGHSALPTSLQHLHALLKSPGLAVRSPTVNSVKAWDSAEGFDEELINAWMLAVSMLLARNHIHLNNRCPSCLYTKRSSFSDS